MKTQTWRWGTSESRVSEQSGEVLPASLRPLIIRQQLLAFLLAGLAVWAPLPFGSVTLPGRTALAAAVWILVPLGLACRPGPLQPIRSAVLALVGLALFGALQCLPLPRAAVARFSPHRVELEDRASAAAAELSSGFLEDGASERLPISIAPELTVAVALWLLALAAALFLAAVIGRSRALRRVVGGGIVAAGLFQTVYGGGRFMGGTNRIWGTEIAGDPSRFRGTFVNPDHFAFYIGLVLPVVFAWAVWCLRKAREELSVEKRFLLLAPPFFLWLVLFLGLALSGSRAGVVAAMLTVLAQGILAAGEARHWRYLPSGLVLAVVGVGVVAIVSLQQGLGRLLRTSSYEMRWNLRFEVYDASLRLWREFPWVGTGLGTFREAFPLRHPAGLTGTWWHAHNDYLELLVTGGVVAALLVLLGVWLGVRRLATVLMDGRRSEDRAAALAALGALTGAAIHSAVDFGLTIPANALTLVLLCGAGMAPREWLPGEAEPEASSVDEPSAREPSEPSSSVSTVSTVSSVQLHWPGHRIAPGQDAELEKVKPRLEP